MKMFFLVLFALFTAAQGSPILTATYALHALSHDQMESCNELDGCRTKSNIIWTCLVTVVSCTWASVHPNIPSPDDGKTRIALRRVGIMICALIAPELVVLWAIHQRIVARRLKNGE